MPINSIPNPSREITIGRSLNIVREAISTVAKSFPLEYTLLENDDLLNTLRVHVKSADAISKLSFDLGQQLDFSLHKQNEEETKVIIVLSRTVGTIDQNWESTRATTTINTYLTLVSKAIQGTLEQAIESVEIRNQEFIARSKKNAWIVWAIAALVLLFIVYKIFEARALRGV